jgi:uncharacterized membrane protein
MTALERSLARLLGWGTAVATTVTFAGVVIAVAGGGTAVAEAGISVFVALPVARLLVMLRAFARDRQRELAAVTALVLAIVIIAAVIGVLTPGARG